MRTRNQPWSGVLLALCVAACGGAELTGDGDTRDVLVADTMSPADTADVDVHDTSMGDSLGPEVDTFTATDTVDDATETWPLGDTDVADGDANDTDTVDTDASDIADTEDTDVVDDNASHSFDDLAGLRDGALRQALLARISGHTQLGYKGDGIARELMFSVIDAHDGRLECVYTGRTVAAEDPDAPPVGTNLELDEIDNTPDEDCRLADGTPSDCSFNTEHSWPRSRGANNEPAESDLHHLFPTDGMANNARGSLHFGDTPCTGSRCAWEEGGSQVGDNNVSVEVFEVRPAFRGDIARAQFYFAVRYDLPIRDDVERTLRRWHAEDGVSSREAARNSAIARYQMNRNPFVDRPDFVGAIADF